MTYRAALNPPLDGGLTFRIKGGASQYWFAVQVGNHGNPLRSVEAKGTSGGFRKAARQTDNYWTIEGGLGPGPYSITVTDVYGQKATATGIRMVTKQVQRSTVSLISPATPSSSPSAPASPSAPPPSPTPTESVTPTATVEAIAGAAPLPGPRC